MEERGTKRVEIVALDDKHQVTAVFASTLTGDVLPPQIKQLKTGQRCRKNPVDLRLSVVKPLSAHWMIKMFDYLKARPEFIVNSFSNVGIFSVMV